MREDVLNEIEFLGEEVMKMVNKSELSRRLNCDRRTVDRYLQNEINPVVKREYESKLDSFKGIINDKVDTYGASAKATFKFIQKKGYTGGYGIVQKYVKDHVSEEKRKATIRFETTPGLQAQVDWKEEFKLVNRHGETFVFDIFLMILGYSRYKFFLVTGNKTQTTLMLSMMYGFKSFNGVPREILFDNMATVVNRNASTFKSVVINERFRQFAKDVGFSVITCRPYRPQTKGKVEAMAKLANRLKVYNEEFDTFKEIEEIVRDFNDEVNNEWVGDFEETPAQLLEKETEYLSQIPAFEALSHFFCKEKEYKVSKESMVKYAGKKYSVPTHLIGKSVTVQETETTLQIYYTSNFVVEHNKANKVLHYKKEHAVEILMADAMKHKTLNEIEEFVENNLRNMDIFLE